MTIDNTLKRLQLATFCSTIVILVLCVTWSPAYGYSASRIDNITAATDNSLGNAEIEPVLTTGLNNTGANGALAARPSWTESEYPETYGTFDEVPAGCPPPVPEPATLILLGMGMVGAAAYRKVRK